MHSHLLVLLSVESRGHHKYMLTFVEDKTGYLEVNFLHMKSDAARLIKALCDKVNTQTQRYTRAFRTVYRGELVNGDLEAYGKEKAITQQ